MAAEKTRSLVYRPQFQFYRYTTPAIGRWVPSMAIWGVGAAAYVAYYMSVTPIFKKVLVEIPVVGEYYKDKIPAADKPF